MTTKTFGSLFSGIGGIDLGLERAGMKCEWQVEKDEFCLRVLEKHWPDVKRYGDVIDVGSHNLETVDLIAGGFPCQPHSVAGERRGAADDRNLWPEFRRVVADLRPDWVLAENVPGIRTTILDTVLSDLEGLAYTTATIDLPACAFNAPHIRHRYFVVAYKEERGRTSHGREERCIPNSNGIRERRFSKEIQAREQKSCCPSEETSIGTAKRQSGTHRWWWSVEPRVGRVVDGVPNRVDRIRALGNAVVPQVAEFLGHYIMATSNRLNSTAV